MLRHLLVGPVKHCFRPEVLEYAGLEVIRRKDAGNETKILVCVDKAGDPCLLFSIREGLGVGVAAGWQYSYKQVDIRLSSVSVSTRATVWSAQSTCMVSPDSCSRCMVALVLWI